jgi:hypothetical protein
MDRRREDHLIRVGIAAISGALEKENFQEIIEASKWLWEMRGIAAAHGWIDSLQAIDQALAATGEFVRQMDSLFRENLRKHLG